MRFYTQHHQFYCGIDLHTRTLSLCVLDESGVVKLEVTLPTDRDQLLAALSPFRDGLVIGCECLFAWYWLADLCAEHHIPFVLGHALYLKAIHGGKTKTDTIDAQKLARLLRGGTFAAAYVYPKAMRATRDLLRRRSYLVRKRAELLAHLQMTFLQYNLTPPAQKLCYAANRAELNLNVFPDASTRSMLQADLAVVSALDHQIKRLESELVRTAKIHGLATGPSVCAGLLITCCVLYPLRKTGFDHVEYRLTTSAIRISMNSPINNSMKSTLTPNRKRDNQLLHCYRGLVAMRCATTSRSSDERPGTSDQSNQTRGSLSPRIETTTPIG